MTLAATSFLHAGLCVLPADKLAKRPTVGQWKPYRDRLPTGVELDAWLANHPDGLCVVAGAVSGNLEIIDFDARHYESRVSRWAAHAGLYPAGATR